MGHQIFPAATRKRVNTDHSTLGYGLKSQSLRSPPDYLILEAAVGLDCAEAVALDP